jgi:DNA-binding CsgD family transcriptional regulator
LREVLRLRALGRTPDDIGTLLGMNPADVRLLIYGTDEAGTA